jgi:hypothetical protein
VSADLRDLLELASDEVPEPDLAEEAWDTAQRERLRLRRRVLLGGGAVAAVGLATAVVTRERGSGAPQPTPSTSATPSRLAQAVVGGATVDLAPDPGSEPLLAPYPEASSMGMPQSLGFDDARTLPELGPDAARRENDASVRAVLLSSTGGPDAAVIPVIHTPRGRDPYLVLRGMVLRATSDPDGNPGDLLDPRTISDDRRRLVFPQPGAVVVVDARDATAVAMDVPDPYLLHAGWAKDGSTVVAWGSERSWTVDVTTGAVAEASSQPVRPGWVDLHTAPDGTTSLRSFSGAGRFTGSRDLRGALISVFGSTVSNTEAFGAAAAYLGQTYIGAISRHQGLVAAQGDLRPVPRVLAASTDPTVPRKAFRPLVWGPKDVVLIESRSFHGGPGAPVIRVLAWDVIGGTLTRVSEVGPVRDGDGGFTGAYVL